jgi:hypothetical protein
MVQGPACGCADEHPLLALSGQSDRTRVYPLLAQARLCGSFSTLLIGVSLILLPPKRRIEQTSDSERTLISTMNFCAVIQTLGGNRYDPFTVLGPYYSALALDRTVRHCAGASDK